VPEEAGREGQAGCSGPGGADQAVVELTRQSGRVCVRGGGLSVPRGLGCEKRTGNREAGGARRERHTERSHGPHSIAPHPMTASHCTTYCSRCDSPHVRHRALAHSALRHRTPRSTAPHRITPHFTSSPLLRLIRPQPNLAFSGRSACTPAHLALPDPLHCSHLARHRPGATGQNKAHRH
jgi:hypothetical protein